MRKHILRLAAVVLVTATVLLISFSRFDVREAVVASEFVGLLFVSVFVAVLIVFLQLVYARPGVWMILFVGLLVYFTGTLLNALDHIFIVGSGYEIVEGVALPVGIGLSIIGFFHLLRNQRRAQIAFETLSITDELTGLYNSRYFYEQLQVEMQRALRYDRELSVLLIDIDDFKKHNDSFGHIEGDAVLRKLGKLITSVLREHDSGYRYGGEEFTVILPETSEEQASIVAERIRSDFKAVEFEPDGTMVTKTLSAGVSEYGKTDDVSSLIRKSDKAMYRAKQMGKDQVAMYRDIDYRS